MKAMKRASWCSIWNSSRWFCLIPCAPSRGNTARPGTVVATRSNGCFADSWPFGGSSVASTEPMSCSQRSSALPCSSRLCASVNRPWRAEAGSHVVARVGGFGRGWDSVTDLATCCVTCFNALAEIRPDLAASAASKLAILAVRMTDGAGGPAMARLPISTSPGQPRFTAQGLVPYTLETRYRDGTTAQRHWRRMVSPRI